MIEAYKPCEIEMLPIAQKYNDHYQTYNLGNKETSGTGIWRSDLIAIAAGLLMIFLRGTVMDETDE